MHTDILESLTAERNIKAAMLRYCRGVDRKDFELFRSAYHADAHDDHGDYKGNVDGLVEWVRCRHERMVRCMHFLGNMSIEINGDRAFVETYAFVIQHTEVDRAGGGSGYDRLTAFCRYVDRFENRAGDWRIARHVVVLEWFKHEEADNELSFGPNHNVADRSCNDPVYALREAFLR